MHFWCFKIIDVGSCQIQHFASNSPESFLFVKSLLIALWMKSDVVTTPVLLMQIGSTECFNCNFKTSS